MHLLIHLVVCIVHTYSTDCVVNLNRLFSLDNSFFFFLKLLYLFSTLKWKVSQIVNYIYAILVSFLCPGDIFCHLIEIRASFDRGSRWARPGVKFTLLASSSSGIGTELTLVMDRITTAATATAVNRMLVWQPQPRCGCEFHNRNCGYFFQQPRIFKNNSFKKKFILPILKFKL